MNLPYLSYFKWRIIKPLNEGSSDIKNDTINSLKNASPKFAFGSCRVAKPRTQAAPREFYPAEFSSFFCCFLSLLHLLHHPSHQSIYYFLNITIIYIGVLWILQSKWLIINYCFQKVLLCRRACCCCVRACHSLLKF
jgi:hypothetical protein